MRKIVVMLIVVLAAVVLPTAVSSAQEPGDSDCLRGIVVEGRCLSIDGEATLCDGGACIEFVEEPAEICPDGSSDAGYDPVTGLICELTEPAIQRDADCPDGARGEVGECFIYRAMGPGGFCPSNTILDETGNCRQAVADAQGYFYCEREGAQLDGITCTARLDPVLLPCPIGTTRFGGACWQLNGLVSPESCAGHATSGTIEKLASGLCKVPLAIPTGPATCIDGATYAEGPSYILVNQDNVIQGNGPLSAACVDDSASIGIGIAHCFFPDDDLPWGDYGDEDLGERLCTRFEPPTALTCPSGYSIEDSLGGVCARFEPAAGGVCPIGGTLNGASCVFQIEFAVFECSPETVRHLAWPSCVAFRAFQGAWDSCGLTALLGGPGFDLPWGCFAHVGPQPDVCNGVGTVESCFEILEPAAVMCAAASGCVAFELGCSNPFGDVAFGQYFTNAVVWAGCSGVTTGTSTTAFSPSGPVTRAQMATFLWRYAGEPTGSPDHTFTDVPDGQFYSEPVKWLADSGITTGTTETTFSPFDTVTREQMAAFIWRFAGEPAAAPGHDTFTDVVEDSYYDIATGWMAETGVTTGTTATTFSPSDQLSRAQAVTFLHRLALLQSAG